MLGSEVGSNSTIQFASNGSKLVYVNLDLRPWDGLSTQVSHPQATTFAICNLSHLGFFVDEIFFLHNMFIEFKAWVVLGLGGGFTPMLGG
jgi:hypothetical protein